MYLSKNSRYVLKRAQVLSPKIFKVAQNNLSVKTPYDDPSKPPLRVNIPRETSEEEAPAKSMHNVTESSRTINFARPPQGSQISSTFDEDLSSKSDNEIRFPNFVKGNGLMNDGLDRSSGSLREHQPLPNANYEASANHDYYAETAPGEEAAEKATSNAGNDPYPANQDPYSGEGNKEAKNLEAVESQGGNTDRNSLYIIIDVPEYDAAKSAETAAPESAQEVMKSQPSETEDYDRFPDAAALKAKIDRHRLDDISPKKLIPKFQGLKKKLSRAKRFDINEIEEPATYVFHLRFNKQNKGSPLGVGCVPEKEVQTRNEKLNSNYVHIKIGNAASGQNVGKQVASIEEFPNIKNADPSRKNKMRKSALVSAGSKMNLLRVSKSSSGAVQHPEGEGPESEDFQSIQRLVRKSKNFIKKNLSKSDPATNAAREKSHAFKFPKMSEQRQEERVYQASEHYPGSQVQKVLSASEVNHEHQNAKVEAAAYAYRYLREWPTESDSFNAAQQQEARGHVSASRFQEENANENEAQMQPAAVAQQHMEAAENTSPYFNISELKENQTEETVLAKSVQQPEQAVDNSSPYFNLSELKEQMAYENQTQQIDPAGVVQLQAETAETHSPYINIFESEEKRPEKYQRDESPKATQQQTPENSPYYSIHELREQTTNEDENEAVSRPTSNRPVNKLHAQSPPQTKLNSNNAEAGNAEKKSVNFQTSTTCVSIGCEKRSPTKFCAAFPPLLSEALKNRLKFSKDFFLKDKLDVTLNGEKAFEKNPMSELSENAILFPKKESEKFDCESLFGTREETILNIIKASEVGKAAGVANEQNLAKTAEGSSRVNGNSVDGLTIMKKVKEIVQFDLDNVVKIFNAKDSHKDVSSVLILKGGDWEVDLEELNKQRRKSVTEMNNAFCIESDNSLKKEIWGDKITEESHPAKYCPSAKTENEMKLDSVVTYNSKTDEFFISKNALADTIAQKTNASPEEVRETLNLLTQSGGIELKGGDSILVFDDETQSWKVDFSILEKREEQMQIEAELTKRSELILGTFEQLEKGHIPNVPLPDTRDKKTFDYKNEQWNAYGPDKKTKESAKPKSPFREPDAEEIRKKNSDLYENLFVAKKKETKKAEKTAPGLDSSEPVKKSKPYYCAERKQQGPGSSSDKGSASTPTKPPEPSNEGSKPPPPPEDQKPIKKEDDNFWDAFLNMNILPRDIREIPKINPTKPLEPSSPSSPSTKTPLTNPDDPFSDTSKKIEEPRFKIRIPFIKDKKIDKPMEIPTEPKTEVKPEEAPKKQPSNVTIEDKDKPSVKVPPPASASIPKEDPKDTKLPPTIGTPIESPKPEPPKGVSVPKETPKNKKQQPTIGSSVELPKAEPPKGVSVPKETPKNKKQQPTIGSSVELPKAEPPKGGSLPKEDPKSKKPPPIDSQKESPKPEAPKVASIPKEEPKSTKKPPTTGSTKESPKVEPPKVVPTPKEDPKSTKKPPTIGSSKEPPKSDSPKGTSVPKEDPKNPKKPPTIGSSKDSPKPEPPKITDPPSISKPKQQDPKTPSGGKTEKSASATDHYVSDTIIEISRNKPAEVPTKIKTNKIETVKLNITPDKRLPSKVTEINLNKKCEEKVKETQQNPTEVKKPSDGKKQEKPTEKTFYKNLEKYKTPFSDPDYEEKALKIKSDIESNPNLKKLDNWSKTLVLQDIMKPPENIETWLKDETDKMATLLLKVLQEAADGKLKKKHPPNKGKDKQGKGNPYDNIRKKQETTPENFLFRVRTVNLSLENDKKAKQGDNGKSNNKADPLSDIPVQCEKMAKPPKVVDAVKLPEAGKEGPATEKDPQMSCSIENPKSAASQTALETAVQSAVLSREFQKYPAEISDEIPGPELLKKISHAWKMFPILGSQMTIFTLLRVFQLVNLGSSILGSPNPDRSRRHAFTKLFVKYGPIVNVQGPLSGNVILIHNPEHLTGVFDQDVTSSVRSVFDSLEQSRRETEDNEISVGISTDWTKPEWNDLKKGTIDTILKGSGNSFRLSEVAADSLVSNIRRNRNVQNYVSEDFMEDIKRWSLEGLCGVLFEKSFGFLERRTGSVGWHMEPEKLYSAIDEATSCLNKCERGFQMWRLMSTPSAMGLGRAYRNISSILAKVIYQAEINLKGKAELLRNGSSLPVRDLTFLESMLLNDGMTTDEITCNLVDIMVIGTNAMNSTLGFLLYNLAQNVKAQMKLLKELREVLPSKDCQLNYSDLSSLKYLQACLKETLRLNFPVPVFYRLLQNDILLSNYIVPKGTYVVMDFRVSSMKEQIFDDPDKFIPDRWLLEEKWMKDLHPFGAFPLCHGPRAEMAKRVVEMQMLACIAKIVRNFQIEYQYGEVQGTDAIISIPDKPLKLNFVEREL